MRHAAALLVALGVAAAALGPAAVPALLALVAAAAWAIAASFLWLWSMRTTPLALGMAVSWSGVAGLAIWARRLPLPADGALAPLAAVCLTGAVLHLSVIARSLRAARAWPVAPVFLAAVLAAATLSAL
ncbi:hypothetical protein DXV76_05690 [Rhodobacteraceae bacterium CCMM004]|nr:hypothetical protein DXV76_05690 [Rhodobacteraceae bacterium CCMM004]